MSVKQLAYGCPKCNGEFYVLRMCFYSPVCDQGRLGYAFTCTHRHGYRYRHKTRVRSVGSYNPGWDRALWSSCQSLEKSNFSSYFCSKKVLTQQGMIWTQHFVLSVFRHGAWVSDLGTQEPWLIRVCETAEAPCIWLMASQALGIFNSDMILFL